MKLMFICERIYAFYLTTSIFFKFIIIVYAFKCSSENRSCWTVNTVIVGLALLTEYCAHLMNLPIILDKKQNCLKNILFSITYICNRKSN